MWQKEAGILLSVTKHNDKSSIIHIFSREQGYTSYMFYLAKNSKGAAKNALLQPLTKIEYESKGATQGKPLQHLSQIRNRAPYNSIPFHPVKRAIALYLSEFLTYALKNEENNAPLYVAIEDALEWFDNAEQYSNFHLLIMIIVARHLGFMPGCDQYCQGYYFDMNEGEYIESEPSHRDFLDRQLSYKLALLSATNIHTMQNTPLTHQERVLLLRKLNSYFQIHIPLFPKLKSIDILEEIFSEE
jgi:DNA repair protein RecO (recombination protein O)